LRKKSPGKRKIGKEENVLRLVPEPTEIDNETLYRKRRGGRTRRISKVKKSSKANLKIK